MNRTDQTSRILKTALFLQEVTEGTKDKADQSRFATFGTFCLNSVLSHPRAVTEPDLEISIVMPCLNEARTVAGCVERARGALAGAGLAGEVIVADNGSTDGAEA